MPLIDVPRQNNVLSAVVATGVNGWKFHSNFWMVNKKSHRIHVWNIYLHLP